MHDGLNCPYVWLSLQVFVILIVALPKAGDLSRVSLCLHPLIAGIGSSWTCDPKFTVKAGKEDELIDGIDE